LRDTTALSDCSAGFLKGGYPSHEGRVEEICLRDCVVDPSWSTLLVAPLGLREFRLHSLVLAPKLGRSLVVWSKTEIDFCLDIEIMVEAFQRLVIKSAPNLCSAALYKLWQVFLP
jgi:hypothetical protein